MQRINFINPVVRAILVIGAVAALVTSITFAALNSQATLTNNTISSGTADLQIDNTDNGAGFGATDTGFAFTGIVPGGADSNIGNFQLKNNGNTDLGLNLVIPSLPTWTVTPSGTVDNTKVNLNINCTSVSSGAFSLSASVQTLWFSGANLTGGPLQDGDTATCTAQVDMDSSAFTGTSASSANFDMNFTGTAI